MNKSNMPNPFYYSQRFHDKTLHLGVTGSIACYKALDLMRSLLDLGMKVSVTLTAGGAQFLTPLLFKALGASVVYDELFAPDNVFAHLEPGKNADALAIVPASADFLAKVANGIADDMLSSQALAFLGPVLAAPAMNLRMWANPATSANVELLKTRGMVIVGPGKGKLACGEEGAGRLENLALIVLSILKLLSAQDMQGQKVMVTLGPTREPWDGVRFWSNPSSGAMGIALATAAWLRGAKVTAICGPFDGFFLPSDVERIDVITAREMYEAADEKWPQMTMGLFCAAVSDYAPLRPGNKCLGKVSKNELGATMELELAQTPDILSLLARKRTNGQKILGFCAEILPDMQQLAQAVLKKLNAKGADLLAGNLVNPGNSAFGAPAAAMAVADRNGVEEIWSPLPKADIAWDLLSWLLKL